ncbi:MAG: hypothetical protein U0003_01820 [Vampirovibrionales bacterium]
MQLYTPPLYGPGTGSAVAADQPIVRQAEGTGIGVPSINQENPKTVPPAGWLSGFYDPKTGKFYQEVPTVRPFPSPSANGVVPTIATPQPVSDSFTRVNSALPTMAVSDDVSEAIDTVKALMANPGITRLVNTYQNQGVGGFMNLNSLKQMIQVGTSPEVRGQVKALVNILKRPDVQAAIRDPKQVLGNDAELNQLLDMMNGLGFLNAKADAALPSEIANGEEGVRAESQPDSRPTHLSDEALPPQAIALDDLLKELEAGTGGKKPHRHRH